MDVDTDRYTDQYRKQKEKNRNEADRDDDFDINRDRGKNRPPKLSEIHNTIQRQPNDLCNVEPTLNVQEEEDIKRELIFKFDILRRTYKKGDIPEVSVHMDLNKIQSLYETTLRRASLDSSIENYKRYLVVGFMCIEYGMGKWLGFDMKQYTQQQMVSMGSYEKLLIELGEKSYVPDGIKWPVEVRLLFMVILNTVVFVVGKVMTKNSGVDMLGLIQSAFSGLSGMSATKPEPPKETKRSMNPPRDIDLEDLDS
jgi:hypothetical protein